MTGTLSGALYVWDAKTAVCTEQLKGHAAAVASVCPTSTGGFVTGGQDGYLKLWDAELLLLNAFELGSPVQAVAADAKFTKLAAITAAASVHELVRDSGASVRLLSAHAGGASSIAPSPSDADAYATCGPDGTVRIWSRAARLETQALDVGYPCTSVAFAPDGKSVAVGLGGSEGGASEGKVIVVAGVGAGGALEVVVQQHSAKAAVAALAFAPDGTSLAVGSADNVVYLHAAADGYALFGICDQHVAPVVALDFSADSKYVRSACAGRDLKFCTALDGSKAEPEAMKELTWASETVPYGWHCKGCYPADAGALPAPPAQLTAFGKSPAAAPVLAAGDAMGVAHLFAYPANEPGAGSTDIAAHVGAIGALAFTGAGALLTAGSSDGAILEWGL